MRVRGARSGHPSTMRVGRSCRHAHRSGRHAGDAPALRNPQLRRTRLRFRLGLSALAAGLRHEELAFRIAGDADTQARHVVTDQERLLALRGVHGTVARLLQFLARQGFYAAAVGGAVPGGFLKLCLYVPAARGGSLCRSGRRGRWTRRNLGRGRRRSWITVARDQENRGDDDKSGSRHGTHSRTRPGLDSGATSHTPVRSVTKTRPGSAAAPGMSPVRITMTL